MTRHVSPQTRALVVAVAAFAAWQFAWIADQAERLETVMPEPWTVSGWLVTWCVVMVLAVGTAICGKDLPTRVTFGALAVVEVGGLGVVQAAATASSDSPLCKPTARSRSPRSTRWLPA